MNYRTFLFVLKNAYPNPHPYMNVSFLLSLVCVFMELLLMKHTHTEERKSPDLSPNLQ